MNRPSHHPELLALVAALLLSALPAVAQPGPPEDLYTGADRARIERETERLIPIQRRHEDALLDLPRVHGMGITVDPVTKEVVFEIAVEREGLVPPLPSRIEGVPVRIVREDPPVPLNGGAACQPCHANQLALPVQMGNSTGNGLYCSACTLGFKVCKDGVDYYVTNAHCSWSSAGCVGGAPLGSATYHRGQLDASCTLTSQIGTVARHQTPICGGTSNRVDAALMTSADNQTSWAIRDIGTPQTYAGWVAVGTQVQKSGRTTGLTYGTVASTNYTTDVGPYTCCGTARFIGQIKVNAAVTPFIQGGDSGSALLDRVNPPRIVGLLFAGPTNGSYGVANKINDVLTELGYVELDPNCTPPDPQCVAWCDAEKSFCQEEYCYWNYNAYMCHTGCDIQYNECVAYGC